MRVNFFRYWLLDDGDIMKKFIALILFASCGVVGATSYDLEIFFNQNKFLFEENCDYKLERFQNKIIMYRYGAYFETFENIEILPEMYNGQNAELVELNAIKILKTNNSFILYGANFNCFELID